MFVYKLNNFVKVRIVDQNRIELWNGVKSKLIGVFYKDIGTIKVKNNNLLITFELPNKLLTDLIKLEYIKADN